MLPRVHHPFLLWEGCNRAAKTRYNTKLAYLISKQIYSPIIVDWRVLNKMGCAEEIENMLEIKVYEAGSQEKIFSSEAWRRAFVINESIYTELCHEFYSTYEFDEVCADDELRTKKLITKISKKMRVLTDEVLNSLSAPTYYRALDTTTLRELIDYEGRLIPEVPALGVPRVFPEAQDYLRWIYMTRWVAWRFVRERLRGWLIGSHITGTDIMVCLCIWLEFTMFHFRVLMTHLVMISSMHISSREMMMSSVVLT
ncbi:hypothetical protein Tco_0033120 [Tanacetum coccineum]